MMTLQVFTTAVLVTGLLFRLGQGTAISSCAAQRPCLRYEEGSCSGGSRTVCLSTTQSTFGGCTLSTDTVDTMCTLSSSGGPLDIISNAVGRTCGVFPGGTDARFSISDAAASSGSLASASVLLVGSTTASKAGSCSSPQTRSCTGAAFTNTIWTFSVSSCSCSCNSWSTWSTCSSSCTRTRSRTCSAPTGVTCATSGSESCTGGSCLACNCAANWSTWSACSSSCQGGVSTRSRKCTAVASTSTCSDITESRTCSTSASCVDGSAFRCHCGGWTGWSACSSSCGTGSRSRTRACSPISGGPPFGSCPVNSFPTSETKSCTGRAQNCLPTSTPMTSQCHCGPWQNVGHCVGSCGTGVQQVVRTCNSHCLSSMPTSSTISCHTGRVCAGSTASPTVCTCGPWINGKCSVPFDSCDTGTLIQTRQCQGCSAQHLMTRYVECKGSCVHGDGKRKGRRRPRLGRKPRRFRGRKRLRMMFI